MFKSTIANLLAQSVEKLRTALKVLEPEMKHYREGMYITHNSKDTISVYTSNRFRAYIPKRFDTWSVKVVEWDGKSELQLDIDEDIYD